MPGPDVLTPDVLACGLLCSLLRVPPAASYSGLVFAELGADARQHALAQIGQRSFQVVQLIACAIDAGQQRVVGVDFGPDIGDLRLIRGQRQPAPQIERRGDGGD